MSKSKIPAGIFGASKQTKLSKVFTKKIYIIIFWIVAGINFIVKGVDWKMVVVSNLYPEVIKICRPFILEEDVLRILTKKFSECLSKGLHSEYAKESVVKCSLTYVADFPDGKEKGSFIGLEFSSKIFRVVYAGLKGDRTYITLSRLYEFPHQKLRENLQKVVDYIARCIDNFIETYNINEKKLIIGVASSFPLKQECLQDGKFTLWGKDFPNQDLNNQDFFTQLKVSLKKFKNTRGTYLISLVNNSTACLLSGLYKDPATRIGLFLGNNTNLAYLEKFENITAYEGDGLRRCTAVDVAMKSFGDDGSLSFIRTDFDYEIDAASDNPGEHVLDKMVSAANLGEIARMCLFKLATSGVILRGYASAGLCMKDSLTTADLAMMEMDDENSFIRCRAVMRNLGYKVVTDEDCMQIRFVARCVAKRSANLVAACLAVLIQRIESRNVRIMGDGYLLRDFPNYESYLTRRITQLTKSRVKFTLMKGEKDEVAVGAGIIAHIYKQEIIKLEDKYRVLPPFNAEKYKTLSNKHEMKIIPESCSDCQYPPVVCSKQSVRTESVKEDTKSQKSEKKLESEIFMCAEPFIASSTDLLDLNG